MALEPSIDKTRVRNLPTNGVFTVNNIAPDGLGNVTITAGDVGAISNVNDTNSIDLTKFGTDISADLVVDVNTDNLISVSPTGTFADKKAIAHSYDNATSGLTATTVQGAIDEVEARVDTAESNISTNTSDISTLQGQVSTLQTGKLETVSDTNSIDLTKTGVNVSAALKLDASTNNLLSVSGAGTFADERAIAHTYDPTASGLTATNVQAAIDEVDAALDMVELNVGVLTTTKLETVSDTNSIDLTKTGVNLSADVKIDPSTNNLTSITASGVFSDERAAAHTYDNATSGLAATQVQAAIDELAAITVGNPQFIVGENISVNDALQVEGQGNTRTNTDFAVVTSTYKATVSSQVYGDGIARTNEVGFFGYTTSNGQTFTVRVETDNAGAPSGTLVNPNAIQTYTETVGIGTNGWKKVTFNGIFAITGLCHVVVSCTEPLTISLRGYTDTTAPTVLRTYINGTYNQFSRLGLMTNFATLPILVKANTSSVNNTFFTWKKGFVGIAQNAYTAGTTIALGKVPVSYSGLSGLTANQKVYLSGTSGAITQTAPASNQPYYEIGYATSTTAISTSLKYRNHIFLGHYVSGPLIQLNEKGLFTGKLFTSVNSHYLRIQEISGADIYNSGAFAYFTSSSPFPANAYLSGFYQSKNLLPAMGLIITQSGVTVGESRDGTGTGYNIFYGE